MLCKYIREKRKIFLVVSLLIFSILNISSVLAIDYNTAYDSPRDLYGILFDSGNTNITGAYNLTLKIISCSQSDCSDGSWSSIYTNATYNNISSLSNNRYLQYRAFFYTEDQNYTPMLFNATIGYTKNIYPTNITLDVGNDSDIEWNQTGAFDYNITINDTNTAPNFTSKLNSILTAGCSCFGCEINATDTTCKIPFVLGSKTQGKINVSNIDIRYAGLSITNSIPSNNSNISTSLVTFGCNATSTEQNINSIVLNVTGQAAFTQTQSGLNNPSVNQTFTNSTLADGTYNWNCIGYGSGGVNASSSVWTLTKDTIAPSINIVYPAAINYSTNVSALNYTVSDTNLQACWYSLNLGVTNITVNCGTNLTGLTSIEGSNTWKVYANDSAGNLNSSSVTFFKDTIYPQISYGTGTLPDGTNISQSNIYINTSWTETNFKNITFTYNSTVSYTSTSAIYLYNKTGLADGVYFFNATVCDSFNNCNSTETRNVTLAVSLDGTAPNLTIISPVNNSEYSGTGVHINMTFLAYDLNNLSSAWWSQDGITNHTVTAVNNQTYSAIVTWEQAVGTSIYNFRICANDTYNNVNCSIIVIISTISETPGFSSSGVIGPGSNTLPDLLANGSIEVVNATLPPLITPNEPPIVTNVKNSLSNLFEWIVYHLSPNNRQMGKIFFWAIIAALIGVIYWFSFPNKKYKLNIDWTGNSND